MIKNEINLKRYKTAELFLEKIINIYLLRGDKDQVYNYYNNLILHMIRTNLNKVIYFI